jgi:hypothetical protein
MGALSLRSPRRSKAALLATLQKLDDPWVNFAPVALGNVEAEAIEVRHLGPRRHEVVDLDH